MTTEARSEEENIAIFDGEGGDIPDRFITGAPGKAEWFHTGVCFRVVTAMKNHANVEDVDPEEVSIAERVQRATDSMIEWHEMERCPHCRDLDADE